MNTINERVAAHQKQIEKAIQSLALPGQPSRLYEPIRYFMSLGGKRMRPVMCMLAYEMYRDDVEQALPAALALELFHNFTLLHDDIMDLAPVRRGQATVHIKWNNDVAILSGDALYVLAYQQLQAVKPEVLPQVMRVFNRVALEVCEGQQYDMDFQLRDTVSLEEYLHMIRLKTSVLLGGSLEIGVLLAGGSAREAHLAYTFGEKVGLAFQIHDDLLDAYGNPESFGKRPGGDILVNKHTFLRMAAEALATGDQANALKQAYALTEEDGKVEAVKSVFDSLGVPQKAELKKQELLEVAFDALNQMSEAKQSIREELKALAFYLIEREA